MAKKNKFYVGQIIRRKSKDGNPIGPYLVVTTVGKITLYADPIGRASSIGHMFLKRNVYVHSEYSLCVSEDMLRRLQTGETICVSHKEDTHWSRVYNNPPEIVRFYTKTKGYEATFVIENVRKVVSLNESIIRITVNNQIL